MGNNESVTAGNKAQADAAACDWYKLLALTGEGKNRLPGRQGGGKNMCAVQGIRSYPIDLLCGFFCSFCHYYESPIAFSSYPDTNYGPLVSSLFDSWLMITNSFLFFSKNTVRPHSMSWTTCKVTHWIPLHNIYYCLHSMVFYANSNNLLVSALWTIVHLTKIIGSSSMGWHLMRSLCLAFRHLWGQYHCHFIHMFISLVQSMRETYIIISYTFIICISLLPSMK